MGIFGNYHGALMVRQLNLHLISKLRSDAALYPAFAGTYSGLGGPARYGTKLAIHNLDVKYLKETTTEDNVRTDIYKGQFYNKDFALP